MQYGHKQFPPLDELYGRPGFMIRRAKQIVLAIFSDEVGDLGVTTTQYGIMWMLGSRPNLDQISLSKLMGLDRSTTGLVVAKLETDGYVARSEDAEDRRCKTLVLTNEGRKMLAKLSGPAQRALERIETAFTPAEAKQFRELLAKLISTFNETIRTPILPEEQVLRAAKTRKPRKKTR